MKTVTLDWKGWWLLRSPISGAADLNSTTAVYAVMGAKLKKVEQGIACTAREPVLFHLHKGGPLREHLEKVMKMSLGVFALKRCQEIRKQPIVYAAFLPDDSDLGEMAGLVSLLYGALPFAPKHHAMPKPYDGEPIRVLNTGRAIGLPSEIAFGAGKTRLADSDQTSDGEANAAMSAAIAQEAAVTRTLTREEMALSGIATERVAKPDRPEVIGTEKLDKPAVPRLIETTKIDKDDIGQGLATERVPKPAHEHNTEFVPKPDDVPIQRKEDGTAEDSTEALDEAKH